MSYTLHYVVPICKCRVAHFHLISLNRSPLLFHPLVHASTSKYENIYAHTMHRVVRYRAADNAFGLLLASYSDRPNKSEQHIFIHLSLPSA